MKLKKIVVSFLMIAVLCSSWSIFGAQDASLGTTNIFQAIAKWQLGAIEYWLNENIDVNAVDDKGRTPLACVIEDVRWQTESAIVLLMNHGARIDGVIKSSDGSTALMLAVASEDLNLIKFLVDKGVVVAGDEGAMRVAWSKYKNAVEDYEFKGSSDCEARVALVKNIILFLLARGANVDAPNDLGESVLIDAVMRRDYAFISWLLSLGANPYVKDYSRSDSFDYARAQNNGRLIDLLKTTKHKAPEGGHAEHVLQEEEKEHAVGEILQEGVAPEDATSFKATQAVRRMQHIHRALYPEQQEVDQAQVQLAERSQEGVPVQLTQTELHFNKFKGIITAFFGDVMKDPIVERCVSKEHAFIRAGKCVFYRAEPGRFRVYEYLIEELHRLIRLYSKQQQYQFVFNRFFANAAQEETIAQYMRNKKRKFGGYNTFKKEVNYTINSAHLLALNIPLFGNVTKSGSCTWEFFLGSGAAAAIDVGVEDLIWKIFDTYGFDKKYRKKLFDLGKSASSVWTTLQQIVIPKNIVDDVVLLSRGYYIPLEEGKYAKVSRFLDQYNSGKLDIEDTIEGMMLMNDLYGLNPDSGIEFHLYSRLPEKKLAYLKHRVRQIADEMFGEWLIKQLSGERVPESVEKEKLGDVLRHVGRRGGVSARERVKEEARRRAKREDVEWNAALMGF
ncbi:MAG TPA: ankyrin repeat domain-containing protein [Candidatus Babeliales bacterium]|nr:ankyrin repeat domain-containing protein [Candidatus Babeliales bacterium]